MPLPLLLLLLLQALLADRVEDQADERDDNERDDEDLDDERRDDAPVEYHDDDHKLRRIARLWLTHDTDITTCAKAAAAGHCANVEDFGYEVRNKHCCVACNTCGRHEALTSRYRNGPPELAAAEGRELLLLSNPTNDPALVQAMSRKACGEVADGVEESNDAHVARRGFVVLRDFVPRGDLAKLAAYVDGLPYPERWLCGASELLPTQREEDESDRACRKHPDELKRKYPGLVKRIGALFRTWYQRGMAQHMRVDRQFELGSGEFVTINEWGLAPPGGYASNGYLFDTDQPEAWAAFRAAAGKVGPRSYGAGALVREFGAWAVGDEGDEDTVLSSEGGVTKGGLRYKGLADRGARDWWALPNELLYKALRRDLGAGIRPRFRPEHSYKSFLTRVLGIPIYQGEANSWHTDGGTCHRIWLVVKKSLDKAKRENGNIQLLHGNFTNGFREGDVYRQPLDDLGCTPVLDPGDAAFFKNAVWHKTQNFGTDRTAFVIDIGCNSGGRQGDFDLAAKDEL